MTEVVKSRTRKKAKRKPAPRSHTPLSDECQKECAIFAGMFAREQGRSGMRQEDLAKLLGKSSKTISSMVCGRSRVTLDTALKLVDIFGEPIGKIIPWTSKLYGLGDNPRNAAIMQYINDLPPRSQKIALEVLEQIGSSHARS